MSKWVMVLPNGAMSRSSPRLRRPTRSSGFGERAPPSVRRSSSSSERRPPGLVTPRSTSGLTSDAAALMASPTQLPSVVSAERVPPAFHGFPASSSFW